MRIGIFYNNPYGGSGRLVFEVAKRLRKRHEVELFTLAPYGVGFAQLEALSPKRPGIFRGWPSPPRPFGRLYPINTLVGLNELTRLYRRAADYINAKYEVALVFPCIVTPAPILMRFLSIPSALFLAEPMRTYFEPRIQRPYLSSARRFGRLSEKLDDIDPLLKIQALALLKMDARNARGANLVLTNSYFSREAIYRAYGIDAYVNYAGVDCDVFRPPELLRRERVVLSVGRISPEKGHDLVIRAVGLLPASGRPAVVIAGDTGADLERQYLWSLARSCGVEVRYETNPLDAVIVRRYQTASIVAFTPIMEPFGFVPIEAMACGTPVVGVKEGGVRETIVDGQGGYLTSRDPGEVASKLSLLLSNRTLFEQQSQRGRQYVLQNWSWEKSISQFESHLHQVAYGCNLIEGVVERARQRNSSQEHESER